MSTYEKSERARCPSTYNNTKSVINTWKRKYPFILGPFSALKDQLSDAPDPINHNLLLLEDILLLKKGQSIQLFLISSNHRMFKKKKVKYQIHNKSDGFCIFSSIETTDIQKQNLFRVRYDSSGIECKS